MNLLYLAIPIVVGLVIGGSVFVVQQINLTGYVISVNDSNSSGNIPKKAECPKSCDDNNPCSIDWCNETSEYLCSHIPINGTSDGCWGNPTICTTNNCISGKCVETTLINCCGNNVCESSENCNSCALDCGECPPVVIPSSQHTPTIQPSQTSQTNTADTNTQTPSTQNQTANTTSNQTTNQPTQTSLNHIIISEIQTGQNEFVELYNPTQNDISVTGWYLSYFSSKKNWNNTENNWAFPNNIILNAGKFFLINIFNTSNSDWTVLTLSGNPYSVGQISNNGSIALFPFNPRTKTIEESMNGRIDALGWNNPTYVFESSPTVTPTDSKSLQRISLNSDTDNNLQDFSLNDNPSPKNSSDQ